MAVGAGVYWGAQHFLGVGVSGKGKQQAAS
jgi:hypothetical protein